MERLNGNVSVLVQHWAGDEMILGEGGQMTLLVEVTSTSERYLCGDGTIPGINLR